MKRIVTVALWSAFAGFLLPGASAQAQTSPAGLLATQAPKAPVTDLSAQSRRPLRRVPPLGVRDAGDPTPISTSNDAEEVERLRALGYIIN